MSEDEPAGTVTPRTASEPAPSGAATSTSPDGVGGVLGATPRSREGMVDVLILLLVFASSRWLYLRLGVRFDATPLSYFWQYLDVQWLLERPFESLYHLHAQPPGWNAVLALALRLGGEAHAPAILEAFFRLDGVCLLLGMYALMRRFALPRGLSLGLTCAWIASPTAILYESWLFYTYPTAVILLLLVLSVSFALERPTTARLVTVAALVCSACYVRSALHITWALAVVALLAWSLREHRRRVLLALALPVLVLVGGLHVKNAMVFGSPAASSWLGMSLAKLTVEALPPGEREAFMRDGALSALADIPPFSPPEVYARRGVFPDSIHPDVPALSAPVRPSNHLNLNHEAYLGLSHTYLADSLTVIRERPGIYLLSVRRAFALYIKAPSQYWFLARNRAGIERWTDVYDRLLYGAAPDERHRPHWDEWKGTCWWALLGILACVAYAFHERRSSDARAVTYRVGVFTIVFVSVVVNLVELGENQRFRVLVEPLIVVLGARALFVLSQGVVSRRAAAAPRSPGR
ncbi:MAG: hypothetical protein R3B40_08710 [Polyangiales bacterium]|nr:hypothetical protein [Myxococcales bacterium]